MQFKRTYRIIRSSIVDLKSAYRRPRATWPPLAGDGSGAVARLGLGARGGGTDPWKGDACKDRLTRDVGRLNVGRVKDESIGVRPQTEPEGDELLPPLASGAIGGAAPGEAKTIIHQANNTTHVEHKTDSGARGGAAPGEALLVDQLSRPPTRRADTIKRELEYRVPR